MPIVLGAFFAANPWPLTLLAAIAAFIGGREVAAMLGSDSVVAGALGSLFVIGGSYVMPTNPSALFGVPVACSLLGVLATYGSVKRLPLVGGAAIFWVAAPLLCIVLLKPASPPGEMFSFRVPALLAILPLWGGDTAAIFAGKAFGRHLLAPTISPKKTWEGAIANLLACVLVAWLLGPQLGVDQLPSLLCGFAAGTLGQAGDLFESYVKRKAGLKDSGNLLPGHGGLMDRIDSILFTAPAVALILWLFGAA